MVPSKGENRARAARSGRVCHPRGNWRAHRRYVSFVNAGSLVNCRVTRPVPHHEYIRRENASAAQRVANTIYENIGSLSSFPFRGRLGRVEGTRELPVPSLPFLVIYRVTQDALEIAGVIHGAQRWPPED